MLHELDPNILESPPIPCASSDDDRDSRMLG